MFFSTRHTLGGYRSAIAAVLSDHHSPGLRAQALRSAFSWYDHPLGEEFWHRVWGRLINNQPMIKEARLMLLAMEKDRPKTLAPVDAREHDRIMAKAISQDRFRAPVNENAA